MIHKGIGGSWGIQLGILQLTYLSHNVQQEQYKKESLLCHILLPLDFLLNCAGICGEHLAFICLNYLSIIVYRTCLHRIVSYPSIERNPSDPFAAFVRTADRKMHN